ncbi:MAG TPA: ElyC/SanA/YdcF family protein [Opitutus sp.]|nr:ElyC/SanA/YdcF family protein [Opitutus sp.]
MPEAPAMFWLKKVIAFWLMPLPFCLALLALGLWFTRPGRRPRAGRLLVAAGLALLVLLSNKVVSSWMIAPLERAFPPVPEFAAGEPVPPPLAACRAVVVLGGGNSDTPAFSAVNRLSNSARARLMEGLRILRLLPGAKLVLSGAGPTGQPSHASVLAEAAISLGVDPARIVRLDTPRDTEDEAAEVKRRFAREPFVLVTSAWHLRRAMALMRHQGLEPFPCPADYQSRPADHPQFSDYTWDTDSLSRSTWAIYERIGYAWEWLRGKA